MTPTPSNPSGLPSKKLKLIHIITFLPVGGVENLLLNALPRIDESRFSVKICCTYRKGDLAETMEKAGVPVHVCRVRSRLHPLNLWKLSRWLKHEKTDVVHTHMYASNITGTLAAKIAHVPVTISHIHSSHEWTSRNRIRMEKMLNPLRSGYIAVSQDVKRVFLEKTRLHCADKIQVIPGFGTAFHLRNSNPALVRREFGIPSECTIVGTVARLVHVKGVDVFLCAAAEILRTFPDTRFIVVGEGKENQTLQNLTSTLEIRDKVLFVGKRLDLENVYSLFDVFVLSSRNEGFGTVILEAMQSDVPVVATSVGGVPEIITHAVTGLLVPPESPHELAAAVMKLLQNPSLARNLAEEAKKHASDFSPAKYVQTLQDYYSLLWNRACKNPSSLT
jgi:glycosyltransferase involved in cell wall biosynthesis